MLIPNLAAKCLCIAYNSVDISPVTIAPSETNIRTVGEIFIVMCSADIILNSLPQSVTFEWFFGSTNSSLPPDVTVVSDVTKGGNPYSITSTLQFSPLLAFHAGMYTCQLGGNERLAAKTTISVNGTSIGLRGKLYTNDSYILITNIGEGDEGALLCFTDLVQCCRNEYSPDESGALGKWFYPNGSDVGMYDDAEEFYTNRGPSRVRLNRRNDTTSPIGSFCCEVPDANFSNITLCANIGEL